MGVGAGYPMPSTLTQKVSLVGGRSRLVVIGSPSIFAVSSILASDPVMRSTIWGDSIRVSDDMTCMFLVSLARGRFLSAFHAICIMHVESLPPLNPSIHGRSSLRYTVRISS